ncbi:MAG: hypothetical protein LBS18_08775 [Clostridiales bacterium]|jgi:hypothetical protein|nr:hypothetical protein [Clostridiales bacterium]
MKLRSKKHRIVLLLFVLLVTAAGCAAGRLEDPREDESRAQITSAGALAAFFENGGGFAVLASDIDMGDVMIKITAQNSGAVIDGGGHTLFGGAPCVLRLDDNTRITLQNIDIQAEKIAVGMLGSGEITADGCRLTAVEDAIHAAKTVTLAAGSELYITSSEGSGIVGLGFEAMRQSYVAIEARMAAISTKRGDITLQADAVAVCKAAGDNTIKTEAVLRLWEKSRLTAGNTSAHNAAKAGALAATPSSTLELTGGADGVGLFIVEQTVDVALKGFCTPEVRIEAGAGTITFSG